MRDSCYKKTLIYGTIILLIGAGFIPGITGYTEKIDVQLSNEVFTSFPLDDDDDYVNAYWKFDETSGSTAHDSSGHSYDGTVYSATWTTGIIGNALDFDGANSYIDLDPYAKNKLGFNKSDDLIFSFYFKSSSTDKGIMYSMSHNEWNYNPGFHIALNPNGTIEIRVWRLSCGIIFSSNNNGYNNGSWHFVEVYYNGITANPTIDLFVDGELDISYIDYVCAFSSDNFKLASMGRNSFEEIDYFDGVLDEFKIIKYPGGNEQKPPVIDGPTYGDPGEEYDYTFVTYDPEGDNISLEIDWGDGSDIEVTDVHASGEEVVVSHSWDEEGLYNVTARSEDIWHYSRWSDPYVVGIGNQPPYPPTIDGVRCGDPGVEYDYTFVAEDIEENNVQYFIKWGDGDTESTGFYPSGEEVTVSHSWSSSGDYDIEARAKDDHGNEGGWSVYPVRIGNHHPNIPDIDGPSSGGTGVDITFAFTATDPDGDDVYYDIDWGDGNSITDYGPYESGEEAQASHTWEVKGTYIIKARARDDFCGFYSSWSEYKFTAPRDKPVFFNVNPLSRLFSRFPNGSIVVGRLLGL